MAVMTTSGSVFFDPAVEFCKNIRSQMEKDRMSGPVRFLEHRKGEIANLADPEMQMRSCAAILARNYRGTSQKMLDLYNSSLKRELSGAQCALVFALVGQLGKDGRYGDVFLPVGVPADAGRYGARVPEAAGEADAPGEGDGVGEIPGVHPGPAESDDLEPLPEPGLVPGSLAGPEEEDSCL